jgi:ferric-dicitrate binding protein FerR (iron transport regulator)
MRGNYVPAADSVYAEPQRDPNVLAWRSNKLVFKDTPLREIIPVLQNQYHVNVSVATPGILDCLFTSTFEDAALAEVLEAVSLSLDLRYAYRDGKYVLTGEGCR